jgi:hypothetical protein
MSAIPHAQERSINVPAVSSNVTNNNSQESNQSVEMTQSAALSQSVYESYCESHSCESHKNLGNNRFATVSSNFNTFSPNVEPTFRNKLLSIHDAQGKIIVKNVLCKSPSVSYKILDVKTIGENCYLEIKRTREIERYPSSSILQKKYELHCFDQKNITLKALIAAKENLIVTEDRAITWECTEGGAPRIFLQIYQLDGTLKKQILIKGLWSEAKVSVKNDKILVENYWNQYLFPNSFNGISFDKDGQFVSGDEYFSYIQYLK